MLEITPGILTILISLIVGIFGAGVTCGGVMFKYVSKDKCDSLRKDCNCHLENRLRELSENTLSQTIRVHERLDKIQTILLELKRS